MEKQELARDRSLAAGRFAKERQYWQQKLARELNQTRFPHDVQNIESQGTEEYRFPFSQEISSRLIKMSGGYDYTLHMILVAAVSLLLYKYTYDHDGDIIVGAPIYRQENQAAFLNTVIPLRNQLQPSMTFKQLLMQTRETVMEAEEHQNFPIEVLLQLLGIEETQGDFPLFNVAVLLDSIHDISYLSHISVPMVFHFSKTPNQTIELNLHYRPQYYLAKTIQQILHHLEILFNQALFTPDTPLQQIRLITQPEQHQVVQIFNKIIQPYPAPKSIHSLFADTVASNPRKPAVTASDKTITFEELDLASREIARELATIGIGEDSIVAILMPRNVNLIAAIMGILKAGAAYLPIDPDYPQDRIDFMLEDSQANALITWDTHKEKWQIQNRVSSIQPVNQNNQNPDRLAYIIYTSGSTGRPKAVMVEHRNLNSLIWGLKEKIYCEYQSPLNIALIAPVVFDASVKQIFASLILGHHLVIVPQEVSMDGADLIRFFAHHRIHISDGTPVHLRFLTEALSTDSPELENNVHVQRFLIGGEELPFQTIDAFYQCFKSQAPQITNIYGPAECCVDSTYFTISKDNYTLYPSVPIGKPVKNETLLILDNQDQIQPIGIYGELCISGPGVSRGYLNQPELTHNKFQELNAKRLSDELSDAELTSPLYRTGDLARWMEDGNIQFAGRIDRQVKIRGFRIELGEIERQLEKHPLVEKAVVIIRADRLEDRYICAYIISPTGIPEDECIDDKLREYLSAFLPEYMIPGYFVPLQEIPLTTNNKIDHKRLPEPEVFTQVQYVAPRNEVEEKLVCLWSELLGFDEDQIGIDTNFFQVGGHSLKAVILINRMQKALEVKVPLAVLFSSPTIRSLSQYLQAGNSHSSQPFHSLSPVEEKEYYPLSSAQKRLYILQQMEPETVSYNIPVALQLIGPLDIPRLENVFDRLIENHESLRTSFQTVQEVPVQYIHSRQELDFSIQYEKGDRPEEWESNEIGDSPKIELKTYADFVQPFKLEKAPLMRVKLVELIHQHFILMVDIHHIVSDGTSTDIIVKQFLTLYAEKSLPPVELQYKDFAFWQSKMQFSDDMKQQEEFWVNQFSNGIPRLNLPLDYPKPPVWSFQGSSFSFEVEAQPLRQLARQMDITLFMLLVSCYSLLLSKLSSQDEIVVGTPVAGRSHADLENIVGMFVNTLALLIKPQPSIAFRDLWQQVKSLTLQAFQYQDYQFEDLVEKLAVPRDTAGNPIFEVMFVLQNFDNTPLEIPGLKVKPLLFESEIAKFQLTLIAEEGPDHILFTFEYSTRLFTLETIKKWSQYFKKILNEALNSPDKSIGTVSLLGKTEKEQVLVQFNATDDDRFITETSLHEVFFQQVQKTPDHIAVIGPSLQSDKYNEIYLSYAQLNREGDSLANALIRKGITAGSIVILSMPRCIEMAIAIFAVLKAGAAYLPIDPDYPRDRIEYMLKDSQAALFIDITTYNDLKSNASNDTAIEVSPSDAAYIIYTSGTTGRPKGVVVQHKAVLNTLLYRKEVYQLGQGDHLLQLFSFAFDGFVTSFFTPLLSGATVVLLSNERLKDIDQITQVIIKNRVTGFICVPPLFRAIFDHLSLSEMQSLKQVTLAGDRLNSELIDIIKQKNPSLEIVHEYGVTECAVMSTLQRHQQLENRIKIGKPSANTKLFILDNQYNPQPVGIPGELYIGGAGLSLGYLNHPELTDERFLSLPTSQISSPIYKTGDLARWLSDGTLEFLGRVDHQVKIRGYRIELAEIEQVLVSCSGVKEVVVLANKTTSGHKDLYAYIVPENNSIKESLIKQYLEQRLPAYMIPVSFVILEHLPLTATGKIDRNQLIRLESIKSKDSSNIAPQSIMEELVIRLWQEVLGRENFGIDDNFFDIGGNSLSILTVNSRLNKQLERKIPVVEMFKYPTVSQLAAYLDQDKAQPLFQFEGKKKESTRLQQREIAVIGMACRFPGASNIEEFWENLQMGIESVTFFSEKELEASGIDKDSIENESYVKAYGLLNRKEYFDAAFFGYIPAEAEIMDPQIRLFHECAWTAMEDAGYVPEIYPGSVGVFAGAGHNFEWEARAHLSGKAAKLGNFNSNQLLIKDFISTRISYKLQLRGPSITLYTACSTSLTAIHTACTALLNNECDAAIAGGVSLSDMRFRGYMYLEDMINSPDGHCRTFDSRARGTVGSEGIGVVLLKPLEKAIAGKDHIYAIIKATAANNDADRKVGYSAPSIEGQFEVIQAAQQLAGIPPHSVTYVETHGTATSLGDPIEIEALKLAFGASEKKYCAIGSVKSNFGHCDTAAGVAGFIKTVLALKNKQIPPSLHYETSNTNIDFEGSPFYVNTGLKNWSIPKLENGEMFPRRAGVSSFGIGGTNVHTILEEAPFSLGREELPGKYIIPISAQTETAVESMTLNLKEYLHRHPYIPVQDIAFTLQHGRKEFPYRRAVVCRNTGELIQLLDSPLSSPGIVPTNKNNESSVPIIFMFPGQGSQYRNMGLQLYQEAAVFRQEMDRCFEILHSSMGMDLKPILYPGETGDSKSQNSDFHIDQTWLTQPLLFSVEYALARQLIHWGIKPKALIGHSLGEYVAACLAGIFSLQDALNIVVWRGKLMQDMPRGAMLSVSLSEEQLVPLLKSTSLTLATINSSSLCVVSGTIDAIEAFEDKLQRNDIKHRRLHTSHAYHSPLMKAMLEPFRQIIAKADLHVPSIPCMSNVTGEWLSDSQATDIDYWTSHVSLPVYFSKSLDELMEDSRVLLLEVGPGKALTSFVNQHRKKTQHHVSLDLIRHTLVDVSDSQFLYTKLGLIWQQGVKLDWEKINGSTDSYRTSLPTYPFEGRFYWLEGKLEDFVSGSMQISAEEIEKRFNMDSWFYLPSWEQQIPEPHSLPEGNVMGDVLVFLNDLEFEQVMVGTISPYASSVFTVVKGDEYKEDSFGSFTIRPSQPEDYLRLIRQLDALHFQPSSLIHLWSLSQEDETHSEQLDNGFYSLSYFMRAWGLQRTPGSSQRIRIIAVTNQVYDITGSESLKPLKAAILGPCNVIPLEFPGSSCTHVDIVYPSCSRDGAQLSKQFLTELMNPTPDAIVAYRGKHRWVKSYRHVPLKGSHSESMLLKKGGVYLITGAPGKHGNIGLILAKYLAENFQPHLALVSRSGLQPHHEKEIRELEACGAQVQVYSADVSDSVQMKQVIEDLENRFGQLNGVIHGAAIMDEQVIGFMLDEASTQAAHHQFTPKIHGLICLYELVKDKPLDFFIASSSLAAVLGGLGVNTYSAANSVTDAFVHWANRQNDIRDIPTRWFSIDWDNWYQLQKSENVADRPPLFITPEEGVDVFHQIISWGEAPQVIVSTGDLFRLQKKHDSLRQENLEQKIQLKRKSRFEDWLYRTIWQEESLVAKDPVFANWLVFVAGGHSLSFYLQFQKELQEISESQTVVIVKQGDTFQIHDSKTFTINPADAKHYMQLFKELSMTGLLPDNILHLWCMEEDEEEFNQVTSQTKLKDISVPFQDVGLHSFIHLAQAIGNNCPEQKLRIIAVASQMQQVKPDETINPAKATLLGPVKVIPLEYPNITCCSIDISLTLPEKYSTFTRLLIQEFGADTFTHPEIAYRESSRLIRHYQTIEPSVDEMQNSHPIEFIQQGVYLITGGMGGMGYSIAQHLAANYHARLILIDISDGDENRLIELEKIGAQGVIFRKVDVSNFEEMQQVVQEAEENFGCVNGIFHTAGLIDYAGVIQRRTREATEALLEAKVTGTFVLDLIFGDRPKKATPDFLVLFSSVGNVLYGVKFGQVGYNAGHEFVDAFALSKKSNKLYTVAIDWNDWSEVGMAASVMRQNHSGEDDRFSITPEEGVSVLEYVLKHKGSHVIVSTHDLELLIQYLNFGKGKETDVSSSKSIDSKSTLAPRPPLPTRYVAPRNETEEKLVHIWQEFFGIGEIGIDDDFFSLGGDSLKAMTVVADIHKQLQKKVPLAEMFNRPTIRALAEYFEQLKTQEYLNIPKAQSADYYPLSASQKGIYVMQQLDLKGTGYNETAIMKVTGQLDTAKIEKNLQTLILRHEVLRTSFITIEGQPYQQVSGQVNFRLEYTDLKEKFTSSQENSHELTQNISDFIRPFDLSLAPLFRVGVIECTDRDFYLMMDSHHIIADGTSMGIFIKEFTTLYEGKELSSLNLQYKDFACWQNSPRQQESMKEQQAYWLNQYIDKVPKLNLPIDFPRPAIQQFQGQWLHFQLKEPSVTALKSLANKSETTLFTLLFSVFNLLLWKLTQQEDIVVGVPVAGRNHADLKQMMGMFINTLAIRSRIEPDFSFTQYLEYIKNLTLQAFQNQDYPFDHLVDVLNIPRSIERNPIYEVVFELLNIDVPVLNLPGLIIEPYESDVQMSKFDLTLKAFDNDDGLAFTLIYKTSLFRPETAQLMVDYFINLISSITEEPEICLKDIILLSQMEQEDAMSDLLDDLENE